jgi:hypothetical protein
MALYKVYEIQRTHTTETERTWRPIFIGVCDTSWIPCLPFQELPITIEGGAIE